MLRKLSMSRWAYQHLEASTERGPTMMISDQEWCRVARWRAGKSQREIAEMLGMSKLWVVKMESGEAPIDGLIQFWRT